MYLGYVNGGGELKVDPTKMEVIIKWWPTPTNATKVQSFWENQYLQKFIDSFSIMAAPLHAIMTSGKSSQWEKNQKNNFEELKRKMNQLQFWNFLI